ncbi:MAG: glycosyltransferase [Clostridiales Family XIII bacterium]|jgi:glycosyltransferase involved in cell wall biosynthesis|nr:glycosyltransferase [Clostridiales Family XIII bacterium]
MSDHPEKSIGSQDGQFKLSVVMPVYNTAQYLDASIGSVISQTIGFEENIQLVLINDGSTDDSARICLQYRDRYPGNVTYVYKENAGVSAARNFGMQYIKGKYVNFFDSDDIWAEDAFEKVYAFFEEHDVDLTTCRAQYYENFEDVAHPLDFKFTGDRVVDLEQDYDHIILMIGSSFFRSEKIKGRLFDTRLVAFEDAKFISELMLDRMRYGALRSAIYHYRKRDDRTSAVNTVCDNPGWYTDVLLCSAFELFDLSKARFGAVKRFIQATGMYLIQWYLKRGAPHRVLPKADADAFMTYFGKLLEDIGIDVIYENKQLRLYQKLYLIKMKCGDDVLARAEYDKGKLRIDGQRVFNFVNAARFRITDISTSKKTLLVCGRTDLTLASDALELFAADDKTGARYPLTLTDDPDGARFVFTDVAVYTPRRFTVALPVEKNLKLGFTAQWQDHEIRLVPALDFDTKNVLDESDGVLRLGRYIVRYDTKKRRLSCTARTLRSLLRPR